MSLFRRQQTPFDGLAVAALAIVLREFVLRSNTTAFGFDVHLV
jgi:hypothetical protein